jgi:hypothetical protein
MKQHVNENGKDADIDIEGHGNGVVLDHNGDDVDMIDVGGDSLGPFISLKRKRQADTSSPDISNGSRDSIDDVDSEFSGEDRLIIPHSLAIGFQRDGSASMDLLDENSTEALNAPSRPSLMDKQHHPISSIIMNSRTALDAADSEMDLRGEARSLRTRSGRRRDMTPEPAKPEITIQAAYSNPTREEKRPYSFAKMAAVVPDMETFMKTRLAQLKQAASSTSAGVSSESASSSSSTSSSQQTTQLQSITPMPSSSSSPTKLFRTVDNKLIPEEIAVESSSIPQQNIHPPTPKYTFTTVNGFKLPLPPSLLPSSTDADTDNVTLGPLPDDIIEACLLPLPAWYELLSFIFF